MKLNNITTQFKNSLEWLSSRFQKESVNLNTGYLKLLSHWNKRIKYHQANEYTHCESLRKRIERQISGRLVWKMTKNFPNLEKKWTSKFKKLNRFQLGWAPKAYTEAHYNQTFKIKDKERKVTSCTRRLPLDYQQISQQKLRGSEKSRIINSKC